MKKTDNRDLIQAIATVNIAAGHQLVVLVECGYCGQQFPAGPQTAALPGHRACRKIECQRAANAARQRAFVARNKSGEKRKKSGKTPCNNGSIRYDKSVDN
jgi:hypothetical protein